MISQYLCAVISRELSTVQDELLAYPDEADIWVTPDGVANSAGNLALHLAGNLKHFIGAKLGGTAYVRNRELEFGARGIPRDELLAELSATTGIVEQVLGELSLEELDDEFPTGVPGLSVHTVDFLIHLASHLAYHAGQINYHRRIVTGISGEVKAVRIPKLHSARIERGH
ncbi:MAG: DinB family protein [Gemmatimonadales bacterium]